MTGFTANLSGYEVLWMWWKGTVTTKGAWNWVLIILQCPRYLDLSSSWLLLWPFMRLPTYTVPLPSGSLLKNKMEENEGFFKTHNEYLKVIYKFSIPNLPFPLLHDKKWKKQVYNFMTWSFSLRTYFVIWLYSFVRNLSVVSITYSYIDNFWRRDIPEDFQRAKVTSEYHLHCIFMMSRTKTQSRSQRSYDSDFGSSVKSCRRQELWNERSFS